MFALLILGVMPGLAQGEMTPRAVVNGKEVANAVIHNGRIYLPADGFAAAIGGTVMKDEKGAYWIDTGNGLPTVAELTKLNPNLARYQALSPYIPNMGIHSGVHGPGLVLVHSNEGTVNAVEMISPEAAGWHPWFDQPVNHAEEIPGLGRVYTQHVYVTHPHGLLPENAGVPVVVDGRYLSSSYNPKGHMMGDLLYIPLRTAVELLGGTVSWDGATFTATAEIKSNGISYEWLKQMNPGLTRYQALSEFVPNMGFHHGAPGPHVTVLVDSAGTVVGFELVVPSAVGWAPWFDQPENQPMDLPGLGLVYSQHIYLVDPASIK
ncbi:MAG: hypothetical protein ACOY93_10420 [Bacillota bacterium]